MKNRRTLFDRILDNVEYNSPVILSYIIICFVAYFINIITNGYITGICYLPSNMLRNIFAVHRLLTYTFAHGSFEHLIGNMALLALTGPSVEKKYGGRMVLLLLLTNSVVVGVTQVILTHANVIGASSIVFMMITLSVFTDSETEKIPLTAVIVSTCYICNELVNVMISDNVSQLSHILGAILGIIFGICYNKVDTLEKERLELDRGIENGKKAIKGHVDNYVSTLKSISNKEKK